MRKYKSPSEGVRIIDNFKRPAKKRPPLPLPPSADEFEKNFVRIQEAEDLYKCLMNTGADVRHLSDIITYIKHDEQTWETIQKCKERQTKKLADIIKKTKIRHPEPAKEGEPKRVELRNRILGLLIRSSAIEDDPLYQNRLSGTKHRPYLDKKIPLLEATLKGTGKPFYYMAALFALFRLMPQGAVCKRCPRNKADEGKADQGRQLPRCGPKSILDCISLDTFRISLWKMTVTTRKKSRLPDDFLERTKEEIYYADQNRAAKMDHQKVIAKAAPSVLDDAGWDDFKKVLMAEDEARKTNQIPEFECKSCGAMFFTSLGLRWHCKQAHIEIMLE